MSFNSDKLIELTLQLNELKDNLDYIDADSAYKQFLKIENEFAENNLPFKMDWKSFCKDEEEDDETSYDDYDEYDSY